jgi:tetratricopeptide (TPR) repeat protein
VGVFNNAQAIKFYSTTLDPQQNAEKLELLRRAAQLDPRSGIIQVNIGENLIQLGEYEQAREAFLQAAKATDPPFMLGYAVLIEDYVNRASELETGARWARALFKAYPNSWLTAHQYSMALLQLGAWDELRLLLASLPTEDEFSINDVMRWVQLFMTIQLAIVEGDIEMVEELSQSYSHLYLEAQPGWPNLSTAANPDREMINVRALADVWFHRPQEALLRFEASLPDAAFWPKTTTWSSTLRTAVLVPVLKRMIGDEETAELELRDYVEQRPKYPLPEREVSVFPASPRWHFWVKPMRPSPNCNGWLTPGGCPAGGY